MTLSPPPPVSHRMDAPGAAPQGAPELSPQAKAASEANVSQHHLARRYIDLIDQGEKTAQKGFLSLWEGGGATPALAFHIGMLLTEPSKKEPVPQTTRRGRAFQYFAKIWKTLAADELDALAIRAARMGTRSTGSHKRDVDQIQAGAAWGLAVVDMGLERWPAADREFHALMLRHPSARLFNHASRLGWVQIEASDAADQLQKAWQAACAHADPRRIETVERASRLARDACAREGVPLPLLDVDLCVDWLASGARFGAGKASIEVALELCGRDPGLLAEMLPGIARGAANCMRDAKTRMICHPLGGVSRGWGAIFAHPAWEPARLEESRAFAATESAAAKNLQGWTAARPTGPANPAEDAAALKAFGAKAMSELTRGWLAAEQLAGQRARESLMAAQAALGEAPDGESEATHGRKRPRL